MLDSHDLVAFVATTNPPRAKEFFAKTLGLRLVSEDSFALVGVRYRARLERDQASVLVVERFPNLALTAATEDVDRLVTVADQLRAARLIHRILPVLPKKGRSFAQFSSKDRCRFPSAAGPGPSAAVMLSLR